MQFNIGWTSETGNSVDLLHQFIDCCRQQNISISSIQQIDEHMVLREGVWVFFVSTTGQGNPPHNMRGFWKNMMKKGFTLDKQIKFGIYSLGDSSYGDNFGMTARKFRQRLKMLGGEQIIEIGLGDDMDSQGYREVYLSKWRDQIINYLKNNIAKQETTIVTSVNMRNYTHQQQFEIKSVQQLSGHKGRKVYWIKLQMIGDVTVKEGDIIDIFPHNRSEDVEWMLKYLNLPAETQVNYKGATITLVKLVTQFLNISYLLNYYFFINTEHQVLVGSTKQQLYKDKLNQFKNNYDEYLNFIKKYKRNVIEFIKDFQCQLPLNYFINNLNQVVGRKYSIAKIQGKNIWLLIKLVQDNITQTRLYKGICTHDLVKGLGQRRKARILQGEVTPRQMRQQNIIITLGTGIAPFVWMLDQIQEKHYKCHLLYTNSYSDQIFHRKILKLKPNDNYTEVVACTREGGLRMIRLLQQQSETILNILQNAKPKSLRIFYCGPKVIYEFLISFISKLTGQTQQEIKKSKLIVYQNW